MSRHPDDGTQLPLPFPATRRQRAEHLARRLGDGAAAALRFAARWALRITLPLVCAAAALQAFPYHATVQGVPFEVQGSLFARPGLSADTTLGNWEFPEVSGVPFGVHISPEDVDVLQLTRLAGGDVPGFVQRLQDDVTAQIPGIVRWLVAEFLIGIAVGLAIAAAINMSVRYLRGRPRRAHELRLRLGQAAAAAVAVAVVAGYGALSYNPDWVRESRLTGTLAAAQLFPDELSAYYSQQSKAFDVLGSVVGIQAALQAQIEDDQTPETALEIMTISDVHLAANYPLVGRYAENYGVDLIVNTGDESAFGTRFELTPSYLQAVAAVTATTPMLWIAGNHDSPETVAVMRTVPGVTVLGTKTSTGDGYQVTAGVVEAFGLTIAGLSDPRVYGGPGVYGADDEDTVEPLQRETVQEAVGPPEDDDEDDATSSSPPADGTASSTGTAAATTTSDGSDDAPTTIDLFAVHEPVAAEELHEVLPGRVRQTVSGHVHAQNEVDELQDDDGVIDLVEGSTGAGGLDNIVRGTARPPIEFSIQSVSAGCAFTRVVRFSIESAAPPVLGELGATTPQAYGDDVTASTVYFRPQDVAEDRTCGTQLGIGEEQPWSEYDAGN